VIRSLHAAAACVVQALRGMRAATLIQLAATGSVAVGLGLVGLALCGASNLERLTARWGRGVQIVAYLKADVAPASPPVRALAAALRARPEVLYARVVDGAEAQRRLAESMGGRGRLLAGIEPGFLPSSLEIALHARAAQDARPLLALLSAAPVIEEVDELGAWVKRLGGLVALLRTLGLALALVVGGACLYTVGSTIRLGVHARREELAILKLVGATDRYVRAPFLLEGALQGLLGAAIAAGLLYAAFRAVAPRVESALALALSHLRLEFLTLPQLALGLAGGALLGLLGSRIALGRYLDV
jgi:cell division transport system permease protein